MRVSGFVSQARPRRNQRPSSAVPPRYACDHITGRRRRWTSRRSRQSAGSLPPPVPSTYPVEDVGPALHGDALEHGQHGEGEVVEVGDAVLGPIPARLAHRAVLALPPVARLQGTGGGVVFCWDISNGRGRREGSRGWGERDGQRKKREVREKSDGRGWWDSKRPQRQQYRTQLHQCPKHEANDTRH